MQYSTAGTYGSTTAVAPSSSYAPDGLAHTPTSQAYFAAQQASPYGAPMAYQPSPTWPTAPRQPSNAASPPAASTSHQQINGQPPAPHMYDLLPDLAALFGPDTPPSRLLQLRMLPPERQAHVRDVLRSQQNAARAAAAAAAAPSPSTQQSAASTPKTPMQLQEENIISKCIEINRARGQPMQLPPTFEGKPISLLLLFATVQKLAGGGGGPAIAQANRWADVLRSMNMADNPAAKPPTFSSARAQALGTYYMNVVGGYDAAYRENLRKSTAQREAATLTSAGSPPVDAAAPTPSAMSPPAPTPAPLSPGKRKSAPPTAAAVTPAQPGQPIEPKRRKKQKIEYTGYARPIDSHGGWQLDAIETSNQQTHGLRRVRAAADLGVVDVYSLVMSMRSRIPSEVVHAVNSLQLILTSPQVTGWRTKEAEGVLDELVALYEEAAFGADAEAEGRKSPLTTMTTTTSATRKAKRQAAYRPESYRAHMQAALEQEGELDGRWADLKRKIDPLPRAELMSSILALFRILAALPESFPFLAAHPRLVHLLLRSCALGDHAGEDMVFLCHLDLLDIRKDVLHIISDLTPRIQLTSPETSALDAASCFHLFCFFLLDAADSNLLADHTDTALSCFARIFVVDANREALGRAHVRPLDLYEYLVRSLPVSESEFASLVSNPENLTRTTLTAMALFNLTFIAPLGQRAKYRASPGAATCTMRVMRKALIIAAREPMKKVDCDNLAWRILQTLALLNDDEDAAAGEAAADDRGPWFGTKGGGKAGVDEDEVDGGPVEEGKTTGHAGLPPLFASQGRVGYLATFGAIPMDDWFANAISSLYERPSSVGQKR